MKPEIYMSMLETAEVVARQLGELARRTGAPLEPQPTAEEQATYDRLSALPPEAFDAAFREAVDAGHVQELALYRDEAARAGTPELRTLVEQRLERRRRVHLVVDDHDPSFGPHAFTSPF